MNYSPYRNPRDIALAHHWLVGMRGGEKVLEALTELFPRAPIYTLVANPEKLSAPLREHPIYQSPLRHFPGAAVRYRNLLPLFPLAVRGLRVNGSTRCIISSDASVIKGLNYPPGIPHVCYCHTPPRYLWSMREVYLRNATGLNWMTRTAFKAVTPYVRRFDYNAARRVTHFIANSRFVQKRIRECYGREANVIYPPVSVDAFCPNRPAEDYYLVVSELVPYKRVDLAVEAFNQLGKKLIVIGDGPESATLRKRAAANITFLGHQPFAVLKNHYERCRAFIFPGVEDFGIAPVEAQAAGRPVIAFAEGGALETVKEGLTGAFFFEQVPEALAAAVRGFERCGKALQWMQCRRNAERFGQARFQAEIKAFLASRLPELFAENGWRTADPGTGRA